MKTNIASVRPLMLIATPWALFNRPSIQVASLKAYVQNRFPDLGVRAAHLHLETAVRIGYSVYQEVSERSWIAEAVAACLLFPDNYHEIERLFLKESRNSKLLRKVGLKALAKELDNLFDLFLDSVAWKDYGLVGFSVSLCQTTSSLLLIQRLKKRHPHLPVAVGGSSFAGERPENLSTLVPGINHLVRGEGEKALEELVAHYCRTNPGEKRFAAEPPLSIANLDELPVPDFHEYFQFLQTLPSHRRFFPTLPIEMSRGCLWQARRPPPPLREQRDDQACAFCNLNLQWQGYRFKSAEKVVDEITRLTSRHQVLSFAFMDNLLPPREGDRLMQSLIEDGKDLRLFAEVRANTPPRRLQAMHRAGVRNLQVGIESLSTGLLRKIGKGTTVMQNIEILRHCEAMALPHGGNLLLRFPGSDEEDVAETMANLGRVGMFRPLQPVHFWLGLDSPVSSRPVDYAITLAGNHANWRILLGKILGSRLRLLIQGYRGEHAGQKRLWTPVAKALRAWQHSYATLMKAGMERHGPPILGYQDGGTFLILNERRSGGGNLQHRLTSASRRIYLHCRTSRSRAQLQEAFPGIAADRVDVFLKSMLDKGLMFEEGGRYLSLAIPMSPGIETLDEPLSERKGEVNGRR